MPKGPGELSPDIVCNVHRPPFRGDRGHFGTIYRGKDAARFSQRKTGPTRQGMSAASPRCPARRNQFTRELNHALQPLQQHDAQDRRGDRTACTPDLVRLPGVRQSAHHQRTQRVGRGATDWQYPAFLGARDTALSKPGPRFDLRTARPLAADHNGSTAGRTDRPGFFMPSPRRPPLDSRRRRQ